MTSVNRRAFLYGTISAAFATPLAARAQQAVYRIGWLWGGFLHPGSLNVFKDELRTRGWIEGQNIAFEHRVADGRNDRLPQFAAELVQLEVSVILASQSTSTIAAKEATQTIPIVMVGNGDPVQYGLVKNLARPESNVTGVSFLMNEMAVKALELLKEAHPQASHVAIFINPTNPGAAPYVEAAQTAARSLGVKTLAVPVRRPEDFEPGFTSILQEKVNALLVSAEGLTASQRHRIGEFAARNGLVVAANGRVFVDAGALLSYAPSAPAIFRLSAVYVDKILRGAKPADLPVEQPTKFELVINLKTARALGLTIPPSLLLRADQVIE